MKPISFYLICDTHFFEPSLGAQGTAYEKYMSTEQYFLEESSDIVRSVFKEISKDQDTQILIFPGDVSKNGEKESHRGFIKELYKLKENGKKVFVLTAGHDYNEYSFCYKNDERLTVEGTTTDELFELYRDFGFADALSVDRQTLSYSAQIADGVRMLALNCDSSDEVKGVIDDRLMAWAKQQIDAAKKDGCFIFAICHYPIIPPVPVLDFVGDAKVKSWRKVASFLADNGVKLVLTGHMHMQSINKYTTESSNRLVDICTSALVGSPAKYRKIEIDENEKMKVLSIDVPDCCCEMNGLSKKEFFDRQFEQAIKNRIRNMLNGDKPIKKLAEKILERITLGTLGKLLFIKVDKSLKEKRLIDFAGETGRMIFEGDQTYIEGTPEFEAISKALKRLGFILKKAKAKMKNNDEEIKLYDMIINTIGNNKGYSDNNAEIQL